MLQGHHTSIGLFVLVMDGGRKSFHPFTSKEDALKDAHTASEGGKEGTMRATEKTGTLEGRQQHSLPMDFISLP